MDTYVNSLARYLLAQSWQIALLAAIVVLISLALRNRSAHIRYLLWLIVLAKCIVPPVYSVPVPVLPERPLIERLPRPATPETQVMDVAVKATSPMEIETAVEPQGSKLALPGTKETAVLVWSLGAFLFLVWIGVRAVRYTLWLRSRRSPLPDHLRQILQESLKSLRLKKLPRIWLTQDIGQPFVWGLLRGSVYLPVDFLDLDGPERCRTILAHELSHVVRFDAAINLLQVLAQAAYWFHPFVWWANRRIRQEREKCCDEMTVAQFGTSPEHYTSTIVDALAAERRSARPIPSLAIVGSVKDIEERIRTMMKPGKKFYKRPNLIAATTIVLIALVTVPTTLVLTARAETKATSESEEKSSKSLHQAARDGDLEQVKKLIAQGADVNATAGESARTPLIDAARGGHAEIVKVLLASGARVDMRDARGFTPLIHAILNHDNKEVVKALVAGGGDINLRFGPRLATLSFAVWRRREAIMGVLLEAGADVDAKDEWGYSPLHYAAFPFGSHKEQLTLILSKRDYPESVFIAACKGDLEKVRTLLAGGDVNMKDEFGCTLLHWGALADSPQVADFLIAKGADVNARGGAFNLTPLLSAHALPVVELLVSKGADIHAIGTDIHTIYNEPGWTKLHLACSLGDKDMAEFLIGKGAAVNVRAAGDRTPLMQAAARGHVQVVELLIAKGADINARDNKGQTAQSLAKEQGRYEIAALLSKHGAKGNASSPEELKQTKTLHQAAAEGSLEDIKALLEQGVDVDLKDSEGNTPLHIACRSGSRRRNIVQFLLDQGAAIDARNNNQETPLDLVSLRPGRQEVAELLLERGAPISTMHIAAFVGRLDRIQSFIAGGAEIDTKNEDGQTPLFTAVYGGHIDIATLLLDNGANVNEKDNGGGAPLFYAIWYFKNEIAKLLIDRGADIHDSALRSAAMVGNEEMAELLVAKGVNVNVRNEGGMSALDFAVEPGSSAIARLLTAKGAEVSRIHTAALVGDLDKLKSFLKNGADINAEWRGVSVLHAASASGNRELVAFLLTEGADINAKIQSGMRYDQTPLHWAASNGATEVAEFLVDRDLDVNARDFFRRTPLHVAAEHGHKAVANLLLSKGASLNAGDRQGRTPLAFAEEQGHTEIVELLKKHGAKE